MKNKIIYTVIAGIMMILSLFYSCKDNTNKESSVSHLPTEIKEDSVHYDNILNDWGRYGGVFFVDSMVIIPDSLWEKQHCGVLGYSIEMPKNCKFNCGKCGTMHYFNYGVCANGGIAEINFLLQQSNSEKIICNTRFSIINYLMPKMPADKYKIYSNYISDEVRNGRNGGIDGEHRSPDTVFYEKEFNRNGFVGKELKVSYWDSYYYSHSEEERKKFKSRRCFEYFRVLVGKEVEHRLSVVSCSTCENELLNKKYVERFFNSFEQLNRPKMKFKDVYPNETWVDLLAFEGKYFTLPLSYEFDGASVIREKKEDEYFRTKKPSGVIKK